MKFLESPFILPDYEVLGELDRNKLWVFYSAVQKSTDSPVLIRTRTPTSSIIPDTNQTTHELHLLENLPIEGVLRPIALEKYKNETFIMMEFFKGVSLETLLKGNSLDISDFVNIAIKITATVEKLHSRQIIHKYIHPANILIQLTPLEVKLTGFEHAGHLAYERFQSHASLHLSEQQAHFISPEQTGRLNRFLDERSDLYSLGVIFYQMLTGILPFHSRHPMDLVHAHIAKTPISPIEANPNIPNILSDIVMKLLKKTAESRYQSADGLKEDLLEFKRRFLLMEKIPNFPLGQKDHPLRVDFGEKMFGRDNAEKNLIRALDASCNGNPTFALISGESGIGKTALVQLVQQPLVKNRGYFISGKFDLLKKQEPYAPLIQAFKDLFKQLLSEGQKRIVHWKEILEKNLEGHLPVLASIIPEIQWITGKQKDPEMITVLETHNRLRHSFDRLVSELSTKSHPLVLFLDDLQWADQATMELLQYIVTQPGNRHLLVIGAYRQNEVFAGHPLEVMQKAIKQKDLRLVEIPLTPLKESHTQGWVQQLLACSDSEAKEMATMIQRITKGNPFFTKQLLQTFDHQGVIVFDQSKKTWTIHFEKLRNMTIADDIVDFIVDRFHRLPTATQELLKLASCIGNQFELRILIAAFNDQNAAKAYELLWSSVEEGLVLPLSTVNKFTYPGGETNRHQRISDEYRFLHDKVQQAIYSTMTLSDREKSHLTIGRLMIQQNVLEKNIFDIVNHFNKCINLLHSDEKIQLAEWNTIAGQKAKEGAAFEASFSFYKMANALLGDNGWTLHYDLAANITVGLGELAYMNNQFQFAEEKFDEALVKVRSREEKLAIYNLKMTLYTHLHRVEDAVESGLKALQLYGWKIDRAPGKILVAKEYIKGRFILRKYKMDELAHLPEMKDQNHKLVMQTLIRMNGAAYHVNQNLATLLMLKALHFTLKHGTTDLTALAYINYALILSAGFSRYEDSFTFGKLAAFYADKSGSAMLRGRAYFTFGTFIHHWKGHLPESEKMLELSQKLCIESGNFHIAGANSSFLCLASFLKGHSLRETARLIERQRKFSVKIQYTLADDFLYELNDWIAVLEGTKNNPNWNYAFKTVDEAATIIHYSLRLQFSYVMNEINVAKELMNKLKKLVDRSLVLMIAPEYYFYESLWLLRNLEKANKIEKYKNKKRIKKNLKLFKRWMDESPANYAHKYYLLKAEKAWTENDTAHAGKYFEWAAAKAAENGFNQDAGLINERAAKFYFTNGFHRMAKMALFASVDAYGKWGAMRKVAMIKQEYSNLFEGGEDVSSANDTDTYSIDSKSILTAAAAISSEIVLERIISKVMNIVLVNGGAQKGVMLLKVNDKLRPIAQGVIDKDGTRIVHHHDQICFPEHIVHYVEKSLDPVILSNSASSKSFSADPYIQKEQPISVLCFPILHQGKLTGIIYLEHNSLISAFSPERIEILNLISSQAAISIENAQLYENLEKKVKSRTKELELAYEHLEKANQELADAEKMRRKFLSNISHDLRSPIAAVQGYIEAILDGVIQDKDELMHYLGKSHRRLLRLSEMIHDLFELSSLESSGVSFDKKPIRADRFFRQICKQFEHDIISSKLNFSCEMDDPAFEDYPYVEVDMRRMEQVVQNLVSNSIKHTASGEIGFKLIFGTENHLVTFAVTDTGCGISEDELPFIFDRFHTNSTMQKSGHGLGLTICKEIVHLHNGKITVTSKVNEGTSFFIHLPVCNQNDDKIGLPL
ncbi:AAA family ATPase [Siminovitchia fortis]|uniref:AAA family ATPase n=2 Tax=Bacillaceae TaxID=186817 RepID=UPI00119D0BBC|nr:AAA family ATPase [Siminovitchia fortis]